MELKAEFKGLIITRGKITFDTNNPKPANLDYYYINGFSDLFTNIQWFKPKKHKKIILENNPKNDEQSPK